MELMILLQVIQDTISETYTTAIITGIVSLIFNAFMLLFVKIYVDKSLESYKISYSGIFKEKIEIHRQLLKHIYSLKLKTQRYGYIGNDEMAKEIFQEFEEFINFYLINQPFIKPTTLELIKKLIAEYQESFETFYFNISYKNHPGLDTETLKESALKSIASMNKFKGKFFQDMENVIIADMRNDLQTNKTED
jgi:hypothetical protein